MILMLMMTVVAMRLVHITYCEWREEESMRKYACMIASSETSERGHVREHVQRMAERSFDPTIEHTP